MRILNMSFRDKLFVVLKQMVEWVKQKANCNLSYLFRRLYIEAIAIIIFVNANACILAMVWYDSKTNIIHELKQLTMIVSQNDIWNRIFSPLSTVCVCNFFILFIKFQTKNRRGKQQQKNGWHEISLQ